MRFKKTYRQGLSLLMTGAMLFAVAGCGSGGETPSSAVSSSMPAKMTLVTDVAQPPFANGAMLLVSGAPDGAYGLDSRMTLVAADGTVLLKDEKELYGTSSKTDYLNYRENDRYGVKDQKGQVLTEAYSDTPIYLTQDMGVFQKGKRYGLTDAKGKPVTEAFAVEMPAILADGKRAIYRTEAGYGLMAADGTRQTEPQYQSIATNSQGKVLALANSKLYELDAQGHEEALADIDIDALAYFTKAGILSYQKGQRFGLMDAKGKLLSEPIFGEAPALAADGSGIGLTDKGLQRFSAQGKIEDTVLQGDLIHLAPNGTAALEKDSKLRLDPGPGVQIDLAKDEVVTALLPDGSFTTHQGDTVCLYSPSGKLLKSAKGTGLAVFGKNASTIWVQRDGHWVLEK